MEITAVPDIHAELRFIFIHFRNEIRRIKEQLYNPVFELNVRCADF
jgi:hypothetical protein